MIGNVSIAIGKLATQLDRFETVLPDAEYRLLGMRSKIGGPFVRETRRGDEVSARKLNRVEFGDFIYSRLFAWQGSFGLVPQEMSGCYVSNEFPIFTLDESWIDPRYLKYWFGLPHVQLSVEADCAGSTPGTRNRYKEHFFKRLVIELPSLNEQRRIVAKIESLASQIDEAKQLHEAIQTDAQAMLHSAFQKVIEGAEYRRMSEVAPIVLRPVEIDPDGEYAELGVRSFGKGVFHKQTVKGLDLPDWQKLYRIHQGDLIFNLRKAWEGSIGVAGFWDHNRVGSHNSYITCIPKDYVATSKFLCFYFLSPEGLAQVQEGTRGSADRNRVISMGRLREFNAPIPIYEAQLWFNRLQEHVEAIQQARAETQPQLNALLPSILDRAFKGDL